MLWILLEIRKTTCLTGDRCQKLWSELEFYVSEPSQPIGPILGTRKLAKELERPQLLQLNEVNGVAVGSKMTSFYA